MMITTHVHDLTTGRTAARLPVELDFFISGHGWREVGHGVTNDEGHVQDFGEPPAPGVYRLMFDVASYNPRCFFPSISITFEVREIGDPYHLVLVLSQFGYSVYRGA